MIAVDTSALMAIALGEAGADACINALEIETEVLISAGTLAEALIVADRRNVGAEVRALVEDLSLTVVPVTAAAAAKVADAHARWGRGAHKAGLNFGDCFAYATAREHDCSLLFVGKDFTLTDLRRADAS